jgi:hypothetical protein
MAQLGTINGKIHVSIGDGDPVEIAQIEIPLAASTVSFFDLDSSIRIDRKALTANFAEALREVATQLVREN